MSGEAIEARLPHVPSTLKPSVDGPQRFRVDRTGPNPSGLLAGDQPDTFQDAKMFGEGRQRHRVRLSQLADRSWPLQQLFDHRKARGIAEGLKAAMEIVFHLVKLSSEQGGCNKKLFQLVKFLSNAVTERVFGEPMLGTPNLQLLLLLLVSTPIAEPTLHWSDIHLFT